MTLNASGPISLGGSTAGQSINLELGRSATAQVSLNESAVRTLAGVPSGAIVMPTDFYGKSNIVYRLDSGTYLDSTFAPLDAQTDINVGSNGVLGVSTFNSGVLANYNWITPTATASTHFVRLTPTSGFFSGDTTGVWLALTSDRAWAVSRFSVGFNSASGTLAISTNSGGTNIVATATITLQALVDI